MRKILVILFALVLSAPLAFRSREEAVPVPGGEKLVVVTPNNQDICRTFAEGFSRWHREKYGVDARLEFVVPGGANDIRRLLETTYNAVKVGGKLPGEEKIHTGFDVVWGGGDYFFDQELKPMGVLKAIGIDKKILNDAFPSAELAGVKLYDIRPSPPSTTLRTGLPSPTRLSSPKSGVPGEGVSSRWIGVCLSSFGIVYNADVYRTLGIAAPKTWDDLTNEKLADWVALADPTHSSSAAVAYEIVIQRAMADAEENYLREQARSSAKSGPHPNPLPEGEGERPMAMAREWKNGMRKLVLIAANARHFVDSAPLVPNEVGNGDCAAGMAIDFYGRVYQQSVGTDRCRVVMPAGATAITPDPVAILYGCTGERYALAKHFVEFLLSREGQRLWNIVLPDGRSLRRLPIRRDVYEDRTGWADKDVNPFTDAHGFNQRAEWMGLFSDTIPIWAAAWIDSRESLRAAYREILKVRDDKHRRELIFELSDLPLEMSDVANMRNERKKIEANGSSQLWKTQKRLEWAKEFRSHYVAVGAKAKVLVSLR